MGRRVGFGYETGSLNDRFITPIHTTTRSRGETPRVRRMVNMFPFISVHQRFGGRVETLRFWVDLRYKSLRDKREFQGHAEY